MQTEYAVRVTYGDGRVRTIGYGSLQPEAENLAKLINWDNSDTTATVITREVSEWQ